MLLADTGFSLGSYSAIIALHVLEHLRDPKSALVILRDLLAKDGSLVIQVPDAASWEALILGNRWNGFDIPRHPIAFRAEDLESLLETCGYKVLRRKRFSLRDDPTGLATSLCPGLDPFVRHERKTSESKFTAAIKDLLYGMLVVAVLPFILLEAASGSGSFLMVEARKADVGP